MNEITLWTQCLAAFNDVLSEKQIEEAVQKFEEFIASRKGKISNKENWGLKKLAYTIQNKKSGFISIFVIDL